MKFLQKTGQKLAHYLSKPHKYKGQIATTSPEKLAETLRPGDVLLVDGNSTISTAIKYLTQSSWSHAALFVGNNLPPAKKGKEQTVLVEADINDGVRSVELSEYSHLHTRICRPIGLRSDEIESLVQYGIEQIGLQYDLQNIFDLARYLFPTPPVPLRFRRRLLSLGSGDPTLAICSSLIARAFQSIKYPILPEILNQTQSDSSCADCKKEMLHIRHHSLFTPRDFDVSPYFKIIKPTIECDFDPHSLEWSDSIPPGKR